MDASGALADAGFESGAFGSAWRLCGSGGTPAAAIVNTKAHTGSYSALTGPTSAPEENGDTAVCQDVQIPANGKLSFWVYQGSNEGSWGTAYAWQEADLLDSTGTVLTQLYKTVDNAQTWVQKTYDLSAYAGKTVTLYFGAHGDGYSSTYAYQYIDDVAITGSSATPTPSPAPSATPGQSVNLILNPGFEVGDATASGNDAVTIPYWTVDYGQPSVVPYGAAGGYPSQSSPGSPTRGKQFFYGNIFAANSQISQVADVSSAATAIDSGGVTYNLSGWLGGLGTQGDNAKVVALFLSSSGAQLGTAQIGPVTPADRNNTTELLQRTATGPVPVGTRSMKIQVIATYAVGGGTDGYADDLSLTISAPVTPPTPPPPPVSMVPKFDHVFFIFFENRALSQIVGDTTNAPTWNHMIDQGSLLTNYFAVHHPSDANYGAMVAGGAGQFGLDANISGSSTMINATNLADLIEQSGQTWKEYRYGTNTHCDWTNHSSVGDTYSSSATYSADDGPFMYFTDVRSNSARCNAHVVPFSQFATDLQSTSTTPAYAWLSGDDWTNDENGGTLAGDTFFHDLIWTPLLSSPAWTTQKTLLVVIWDEDNFTPVNNPAAIFMGSQHVKAGFRSNIRYTHYSALKTIEAALGLPTLTNNDKYATLINDIWQ